MNLFNLFAFPTRFWSSGWDPQTPRIYSIYWLIRCPFWIHCSPRNHTIYSIHWWFPAPAVTRCGLEPNSSRRRAEVSRGPESDYVIFGGGVISPLPCRAPRLQNTNTFGHLAILRGEGGLRTRAAARPRCGALFEYILVRPGNSGRLFSNVKDAWQKFPRASK